jgi:transcriptional regulator with XRE-family HTH domain
MCFDRAMTITRTAIARETERRMRRHDLAIGEEVRRLRLDAGVTLQALSAVVGVHRTYLARIEAGRARPSIEVLTAIAVALGADLGVRFFAGSGPRLVDRFQAAMVEIVLMSLDLRWHADLEVPVTTPTRGVIDLVLTDRTMTLAIAGEAQSEIRRLEQQIRWSTEKADGLSARLAATDRGHRVVTVSRLLVLRSTVNTRDIARRYGATLATAYPAKTRDVVLALTTPTAPWPGSGIIWVHLDGSERSLMPFPPPKVQVGR